MTNRTFLNPPKKGNQRNHIATEPAPLAGLPHVTFYRPLPSVPAESIEESGCQIADIYEDGIELPMVNMHSSSTISMIERNILTMFNIHSNTIRTIKHLTEMHIKSWQMQ